MRIGFTYERKDWHPANLHPVAVGAHCVDSIHNMPAPAMTDADSELLTTEEEAEIIEALTEAGHQVIPIGDAAALLAELGEWRDRCDLVFNRSVGYLGVERKGVVAGLLDAIGLPYTGSTPYVLSLTRNKLHAKLVAGAAGVLTPPAVLVEDADTPMSPHELAQVRFPAIVKPVAESSSIGIERGKAIAHTAEAALTQARALVGRYQQPALIETFIEGAEIEVPIVADPGIRAFGVACIGPVDGTYDGNFFLASEDVYDDGYDYVPLPSFVNEAGLIDAAVRGARALGIRDYGRLDFRVDRDGTPWFIEASTHPHVQRHSGFFAVAQQQRMSYPHMLDMLIQIAAHRCGLVVMQH